jgi:hypothetical protein
MPRVVLPVKVAETGAVVNVELQNPYQDDRWVLGLFSIPLEPLPEILCAFCIACSEGRAPAGRGFVRHDLFLALKGDMNEGCAENAPSHSSPSLNHETMLAASLPSPFSFDQHP